MFSASIRRFLPLLLWACLFGTGTAAAQNKDDVQVYLTVEQALKEVFPQGERYITETVRWSAAELARARQVLNRREVDAVHEVVLVYDRKGQFTGYAVITEELGKYQPITFIVGVRPDFSVEKTAIMVYRESRGGEVRMPRFLYQYKGKKVDDPIRLNRDIINISGATISVRSVNAGVRKVLHVVTETYRKNPPARTFEAERATISKSAPK